jgi:hypothetical protein
LPPDCRDHRWLCSASGVNIVLPGLTQPPASAFNSCATRVNPASSFSLHLPHPSPILTRSCGRPLATCQVSTRPWFLLPCTESRLALVLASDSRCHGTRCAALVLRSIIYALTCTVRSFLVFRAQVLQPSTFSLYLNCSRSSSCFVLTPFSGCLHSQACCTPSSTSGAHGSALFLPTKPPSINLVLTRPGSVLQPN